MAEGDSFISDESSFYGDEEEKKELEQQAENQGTALFEYWSNHDRMINTIAWRAKSNSIHSTMPSKSDLGSQSNTTNDPHNPWQGREDSWQLGETIKDFTKRLPVLNSTHIGPWIWVANPFADRNSKTEYHDAIFVQLASRLLKDYIGKKEALTATHPEMAPGKITRTLKPHRDQLKEDILSLAKEREVICGKWMLFPKLEDAPRYWYKVAEATIDNRLGIGAKISTGLGEAREERLICIYTKDFFDMDDIRRVLEGLVELGFVSVDNPRGIYYKPDAYTYLDISSGNEYGLQASLYSSRDLLRADPSKSGKQKSGKREQVQMKLDTLQ